MFDASIFSALIFAHSLVFVLLPLPFLIARLPWVYTSQRLALKAPFVPALLTASGTEGQSQQAISKATSGQKLLAFSLWILVLIALAKPQLMEAPIVKEFSQRDLLLAVDLSGSMETQDFASTTGKTIDRLAAVKEILTPFFAQRQGERMGLIFFGSAAFVQAPFTTDLTALNALLHEAQVAMAGPKTVIGDSIALAVKLFEESKVEDRLLLLLTDGNDTTSKVPPKEASELAKKNKIKIITIAIGDPKNAGEIPIDSKTLQDIADTTGGALYYAVDNSQLIKVLDDINRLVPKKVEQQTYNPTKALYMWPLFAITLLLFLYMASLFLFPRKLNP